MAEFSETSSILISLIIGVILTILFDNVFVVIFIGFISTYIVDRQIKSYLIGVKAALTFTILNFFIGLISVPNIPQYIAEQVGFDPVNFFIGLLVSCLISGVLGFIGGYVADITYSRFQDEKQ